MKILVTGGCGFIGSNLVRYLMTSTKHQVVNVDKLTYAGNHTSIDDVIDSDRYVFSRTDITDVQALRSLMETESPDWIMHLAAESHVDRSIDGPADFVDTNVIGTFSLLSAAKEYFDRLSPDRAETFRFLHVSTDEVYGSLGTSGKFSETTAYDPHSPYSASKAASDHLARAWHTTYKLPVIVTNCSNNFGPYQYPEKLLPLMILRALKEQSLPVYGQGENIRDWLYVADHVTALMMAIEKGVVGRTYNIGGDCELRNIDLVRQLCEILDEVHPRNSANHAELITFVDDRPGHDFRYAMDSTRIRRELGWQPQHTFDQRLRETVHWYLENQSWWQAILNRNDAVKRIGMTSTPNSP